MKVIKTDREDTILIEFGEGIKYEIAACGDSLVICSHVQDANKRRQKMQVQLYHDSDYAPSAGNTYWVNLSPGEVEK